jgi:hypothetical protein
MRYVPDEGCTPLSEHEQSVLRQIEQSLGVDPYPVSRGRRVLALLTSVVGLAAATAVIVAGSALSGGLGRLVVLVGVIVYGMSVAAALSYRRGLGGTRRCRNDA